MDFHVSEEMTVMLAMIREFMDREVIPLEGEMLYGDPATLEVGVRSAQAKVKQMGLWAPNHPVEIWLDIWKINPMPASHKFAEPISPAPRHRGRHNDATDTITAIRWRRHAFRAVIFSRFS